MAEKKSIICPFNNFGCEGVETKCHFWTKKGCQIERALRAMESLPRKLDQLQEAMKKTEV